VSIGRTQIGRYEVVGQLAMGGMAEILLGRLLGPSGFERVVVIKRILPNLSQQGEFREMFLDEARIAAAIHHPNVVQVHELGQENDQLFLVMEYLEGESLHGLLRRLVIVGEPLDPALVAYIGAQACAGLHAAHELRDGQGRSVGLVHRDISPQNVFVTYEGAVKILDFGIAKAADRITQTEAGMLKGKFAYMSPEQCLGELPDRRSDLFSLGVVLYEAVTGRRLFHRGSQLKTLRAVVDGAFPPPSELCPSLPQALEDVILTALARSRDERFGSAADMRRALAEATSAIDGPAVPEEALAGLMRRLFPDRIEEKSAMLQRVRSGSSLTAIPAADIDIDIELPSIVGELVADGAGPRTEAATPAAKTRRWVQSRAWAAVTAILALVTAVALWLSFGQGPVDGEAGDGRGSVASAAPATTPPPRASNPPSEPELPATAAAEAGVQPEPTTAPPERVTVRVQSSPSGAEVVLAGELRGTTPLELDLDRGDDPLGLRVTRGRLEHTTQVVPDRDRDVELILARPSPRRRGRARSRRRAPEPTDMETDPSPPSDDFARFD
jgi:serine/threonine protein kinase